MLSDFNEMSVGMVLDYIDRCDILNGQGNKQEMTTTAEQKDFNIF